ncbi:FAD-binding oxidoreductase [Shewanella sp. Scap07]|uniref:NAD(P)/FAD-dependent oxidoreductase n=1 Tax=Shewanella sp. Scap07 TaxID=2589987 RepID=UPI0021186526|nr:FAD-dependent oxidoreductase [Shewanella sp. Scap07]
MSLETQQRNEMVKGDGSITIIGAGIVGLAAAIELQRVGYQVTIIDKEGPGAGASQGNAGHFATEQMFPLADPAMLLKLPGMLLDPLGPFRIQPRYFFKALPWFCRFLVNMLPSKRKQNQQGITALNKAAIAAMQDLVRHCDCEELLTLNGSLLVFESTPLTEVEAQYRAYSEAGVAVQLLDGAQVRALEPSLSDNITHALYFTDVGHSADPMRLCQALAAKFVAAGGKMRIESVAAVNTPTANAGVELTMQSGDRHFAASLLVAAGAWSKPFAKHLGYNVPLETERGYHLMMPQHSRLSRPVASYNRKFIITPMEQGTRLAGTVEFGGLDAPLVEARADCLLPHAKALLPALFSQASVEDGIRWLGFRPSLPDSLPVLGRSPKHSNVYFSFGHQHLGLTWSAVTAKLLKQEIQGKQPDIDLTPYRIERYGR